MSKESKQGITGGKWFCEPQDQTMDEWHADFGTG